ncbi:hypothetical protein [Aidingimonas halophila]|uniref:Uncharacterized protein n=1 Tax=Aidingimonas halophila TaxID=574349 RepID=A0A1H2UC48_9GAMM|nr:hypothetical protein [Aidingimonas halophila]GHC22378.1 hypothetical protein GCM10008094_11100 [Aidingimonas halophila]SDW53034.1 hypothetical protein SAMN05443545_102103 [Aidingimonas halophila]
MMIVDLIDGDDFRHRLVALGVRIPEGSCPETCARMALRRHRDVGVPGLREQVQEWMQHTDMMLPSVRQAIERFLLPGLR